MKVYVPAPLRLYTGKISPVEADGTTLAELFDDMERRYMGIRFRVINEQERIREHIKIFVNQEQARTIDRARPVASVMFTSHGSAELRRAVKRTSPPTLPDTLGE